MGSISRLVTSIAAGFLRETPETPSVQPRLKRAIQARYDAATPDLQNARHFAMADGLSAREANNPGVRERLRNYARYETANNCYARGMVNTIADVEMGSGAHLHLPRPLKAGESLREGLKAIEREFEYWAEETGLWEKLWTLRVAKATDGEGVAVLRVNDDLQHLVTLDIQPIEAEQLSHGWQQQTFEPGHVDGVEVDGLGNIKQYFVLPEHPGDATITKDSEPMEVIPNGIIHWFRRDRPGQLRGIPEITPALPLFAQLRRFTLASLTAAETAADIVGIIKSSLVPEEPGDPDRTMELYEMHRGMFMELPDGSDISQLESKHPGPQYKEFKRELLCEIARCLNLPKSFALGDASDYNYASGRLDRQEFDRHIEVAHRFCERQVLGKIWNAWWGMASLMDGYFSDEAVALVNTMRPKWGWPKLGHVDRAKEEQGRETALRNMTTTLAAELDREGIHWEDHLEQVAAERQRMEELGLAASASDQQPPKEEERESDEELDKEAA